MSAILAAGAVLLAFGAAWQVAGDRGENFGRGARRWAARFSAGRIRSLAEAALALGVPTRLEQAGLAGRISLAAVVAAKAAGALVGIGCALVVVPVVPSRLGLAVAPALAFAGFVGPDALLERASRRRSARLVGALPDALDLLAVGASAGRSPAAVVRDLAAEGSGPLESELAMVTAELEAGTAQRKAFARFRERTDVHEVVALEAALERSRRYGSSLADQLHAQAGELRADAARRLEEAAARSAPKIQLVVALVLVPSVLLMILAAILAHADALFGRI